MRLLEARGLLDWLVARLAPLCCGRSGSPAGRLRRPADQPGQLCRADFHPGDDGPARRLQAPPGGHPGDGDGDGAGQRLAADGGDGTLLWPADHALGGWRADCRSGHLVRLRASPRQPRGTDRRIAQASACRGCQGRARRHQPRRRRGLPDLDRRHPDAGAVAGGGARPALGRRDRRADARSRRCSASSPSTR
jgi:hypothetical protein